MLPYFVPPYGMLAALRAMLAGREAMTGDQVENLFADQFGIQNAILLPSARAGILWGLKAWGSTGMRVVSSVFTCTAVWEAVFRAGAEMDGVDVGPGSFLMDTTGFSRGPTSKHALVLSEIYGHTYDLRALRRQPGNQPALRIVDLAGGLLHRDIFTRLDPKDLAVISFGRGSKAMYCGWGGMAFTNDRSLGGEIKKIRDAEIQFPSTRVRYERALRLLLVSLLRTSAGCSIKQGLQSSLRRRRKQINTIPPSVASEHDCSGIGKEFYSSPTRMERYLMARNLMNLQGHIEHREELVKRYNRNLKDIAAVVLPADAGDVLSHYSIRVASEVRNEIVDSLAAAGVEAGRLFFFSPGMLEYRRFVVTSRFSQKEYPIARRTAAEVINLPLHPGLTSEEVDWISEQVRNLVTGTKQEPVKPLNRRVELQSQRPN